MGKAFTYRGTRDLELVIGDCCRKKPPARRSNQDCILSFSFRILGRARFCGDHLGAESSTILQQSTKKAGHRGYEDGGKEDQEKAEMWRDWHMRSCVYDSIYRCGTLVHLCDRQGHCRRTHTLIFWQQDPGVSIQIVAWRRLLH